MLEWPHLVSSIITESISFQVSLVVPAVVKRMRPNLRFNNRCLGDADVALQVGLDAFTDCLLPPEYHMWPMYIVIVSVRVEADGACVHIFVYGFANRLLGMLEVRKHCGGAGRTEWLRKPAKLCPQPRVSHSPRASAPFSDPWAHSALGLHANCTYCNVSLSGCNKLRLVGLMFHRSLVREEYLLSRGAERTARVCIRPRVVANVGVGLVSSLVNGALRAKTSQQVQAK
ncbi:unnamed protein product [Protopolystoma xenopodis]|uniref:Uncharacterized protein n=1 Tax=Protopolystoma xenopodis TaxID=117903 RepID=A0A448XQX1_9PLAT|nr:unnamed protein product [Protopolystoma xenopodis]